MPVYFTYITPECEREAQEHGLLDDVRELAEKVERNQDVGNLYHFPKIFRRKNLGRSYRLIMGEVHRDDDGTDAVLLVFWHVWSRSSREYKEFIEHPRELESTFRQDCENLTPPIDQIWEEKLQSAPPETLPQRLSLEERQFLEALPYHNDEQYDDWIVLESEEWVKRTDKNSSDSKNLSTRLSDLLRLITRAVQNAHMGDCKTTFVEEEDTGILYRTLCERKVIFLIAPFQSDDKQDREELRKKYRNVLETSSQDELQRHSWRSYPDLVLADKNLWEHIQTSEKEANLSLSAEEAEILRSSRLGQRDYPLFINGRPGSGKSTVLQFLFAEYLYKYLPLADALKAPPLYLTYSGELLKQARKNVEAILKSNAYHQLREEVPNANVDSLLQDAFSTLKNYLYGLLPEDKKKSFPDKGHLPFPEFRSWYEKTFGRDATLSSINAELAWHVIRSYIKGLSSDKGEYLDDVQAFEELPGQKSVTSETFSLVAQRIWPRYQEWCQENHFWDDQDLVREILTSWADIPEHEHVAVFCDEAQDFSLNELRFIFRLSLYTRRQMRPHLLKRIPLAFAGDPFQTINPTGFDWDTIRGNFSITMRETLYSRSDDDYPSLEKPTELAYNYRSSPDIVQVCNFIHLLRGLVFRKRHLRPQEAWFRRAARTPVYFAINSEVFQSKIRSQQETVIILPCQEGEEQAFIEADPFLATIGIENGRIARNILSPMRAKGLEYNRVVLYKFGEVCLRDYPKLLDLLDESLNGGPNTPISSDEMLPLEYFMNRLYVAASRARERLFIADTPEGLRQFWQKYFERTDLRSWVEAYGRFDRSTEWTTNHIGKIQEGSAADWEGDRDDPRELAEEFKERGKAEKDLFLLQRAASNYRMAGDEAKAKKCDAYRLELEGNLVEAGKIWQSLGEQKKAKDLFWQARAFDELASFGDGSLQQRVARLMINGEEVSFEQIRVLLEDIERYFETDDGGPDKVWQSVLGELYQRLLSASNEKDLDVFEWKRIYKRAKRLREEGLLERDEVVNQLHLRATPYPKKLRLLRQYRRPVEEIVSYYKSHRDHPFDDDEQDEQVEIVLWALRAKDEKEEIQSLVKQYPSERNFALVLAYYAQKRDDLVYSWAQELLRFWEDHANWDAALDFVKGKSIKGVLDERDAEAVRKYPWKKFDLDEEFIKLLSVSERLSEADTAEKNQISRYLSETILQKPDVFSKRLTVQQAGGALERAGKITDCLEFYEMVFKHGIWPANENDQQFARERWLVCKRRQSLLAPDRDRQHSIQREINARAREWGIDLEQLPEYPTVDVNAVPPPVKLESAPERVFSPDASKPKPPRSSELEGLIKIPASKEPSPGNSAVGVPKPSSEKTLPPIVKVQFEAHGQRFMCKLDRARGKMTLQLYGEMEMVTLLAKDLSIQGSDEDFSTQIETVRKNESGAEYLITSWNITCVFRTLRIRRRRVIYVDLYLGRKEFEMVSLRLAEYRRG